MLTPEQARDLAEHFGSQSAAARVAGVTRSTLQHWLNPEYTRARQRVANMTPEAIERQRVRQRAHKRAWRATDPERCEREREWKREHYRNLSGYDYNRLLLRQRRNKALVRREQRTNQEA